MNYLIIARPDNTIRIYDNRNLGGVEKFVADTAMVIDKLGDSTVDVVCDSSSTLGWQYYSTKINLIKFKDKDDMVKVLRNLDYSKYDYILNNINLYKHLNPILVILKPHLHKLSTYLHGVPGGFTLIQLQTLLRLAYKYPHKLKCNWRLKELFQDEADKHGFTINLVEAGIKLPDPEFNTNIVNLNEFRLDTISAFERMSGEKNPTMFGGLARVSPEFQWNYYSANGIEHTGERGKIIESYPEVNWKNAIRNQGSIQISMLESKYVTCLSRLEAFGYTAKEAISLGVPVIAYNSGQNVVADDMVKYGNPHQELDEHILLTDLGFVLSHGFNKTKFTSILASLNYDKTFDHEVIEDIFARNFMIIDPQDYIKQLFE